nr:RtcB family protein [uncultured Desulfuromonas sp.]
MKPHHIFADAPDGATLDQFYTALKQEFTVRGALMPDAHLGYALPIGGVVATQDVIVPAWVGYDIGCGMCAVPTTFAAQEIRRQAEAIFNAIYRVVPVGYHHNRHETAWHHEHYPCSPFLGTLFAENGLRQLGSLGNGNHFIEIGSDDNDRVWIIVHSGSRNLGHSVASHYMKLAAGSTKARQGHDGLAVDCATGRDYLKDLTFCLAFALENRHEMIRRVVQQIQRCCPGEAQWAELINRNHNHAEEKDGVWIHRKGATHAEAGMMGVIPGNMRDGSFIIEGKGNPLSLWSSSHGAGRILSRRAAKEQLSMKAFSRSMDGIVAQVTTKTLDESPSAYKDIFAVMEQQKDLVIVHSHVKPIINIKG